MVDIKEIYESSFEDELEKIGILIPPSATMLVGMSVGSSVGSSVGKKITENIKDPKRKRKIQMVSQLVGSGIGLVGGLTAVALMARQSMRQRNKYYSDFYRKYKDWSGKEWYRRAAGAAGALKPTTDVNKLIKLFGINASKVKTKSGLRKAYWSMAKKVHPDKFSKSMKANATKQFQQLSNAYHELKSTAWYQKLGSFIMDSFEEEIEKIGKKFPFKRKRKRKKKIKAPKMKAPGVRSIVPEKTFPKKVEKKIKKVFIRKLVNAILRRR